ncbi:MAG: LamG domain-containing protein [Acidobacteriota bacterium]
MPRLLLYPILVSFSLLAEVPSGLTFHASFESETAKVAKGDARLYSAPNYKEQSAAQPGLAAAPNAKLAPGEGRNGSGALRVSAKNENAVFYRAEKNVAFKPKNWTGTISFFLKLDPETDLAPGFCDPIQVTDKAYNDSAIWVDFTKDDKPRHFRLGVFGELKVWNPTNQTSGPNPAFDNRLVIVKKTPFARDHWTHVAITHQSLGSGKGTATLYLDGTAIGTTPNIAESFAWNPALSALRLGVNYVGLMDDVMVFNRVLKPEEIQKLAK